MKSLRNLRMKMNKDGVKVEKMVGWVSIQPIMWNLFRDHHHPHTTQSVLLLLLHWCSCKFRKMSVGWYQIDYVNHLLNEIINRENDSYYWVWNFYCQLDLKLMLSLKNIDFKLNYLLSRKVVKHSKIVMEMNLDVW